MSDCCCENGLNSCFDFVPYSNYEPPSMNDRHEEKKIYKGPNIYQAQNRAWFHSLVFPNMIDFNHGNTLGRPIYYRPENVKNNQEVEDEQIQFPIPYKVKKISRKLEPLTKNKSNAKSKVRFSDDNKNNNKNNTKKPKYDLHSPERKLSSPPKHKYKHNHKQNFEHRLKHGFESVLKHRSNDRAKYELHSPERKKLEPPIGQY